MNVQAWTFVIVGRDSRTGTPVGSVSGWPGARHHGASLDELVGTLREVLGGLREGWHPRPESESVGLQTVRVAQA
jgi:predicted RNase H-like HicB family nuclease